MILIKVMRPLLLTSWLPVSGDVTYEYVYNADASTGNDVYVNEI